MEKVGHRALDLLEALAAQAGTTVEQLYPMWIEAIQRRSATALVAWLLVSAMLGAIGLVCFVWATKSRIRQHYDDQVAWTAFGLLACLFAAVLAAIAVAVNLPGVLSPEYYASQELLEAAAQFTRPIVK